jgi:ribonucleotide monophosphatase NagD (HAD superfamily)
MLDLGAFAAALEYASGREAVLAGKPAVEFFTAALASLGVAPAEAAVIGDDLESDVAGGQAAGMKGILVRTGKFRPEDAARSGIRPDATLDSLAQLATLL